MPIQPLSPLLLLLQSYQKQTEKSREKHSKSKCFQRVSALIGG